MIISENLLARIQEIEEKIKQLDKDINCSNVYSLNSMKEHIEEIKWLFNKGNEHWKDESIDLFIHSLLFLSRNGCEKDMLNIITERRIKKFIEKISAKIEDKNKGNED